MPTIQTNSKKRGGLLSVIMKLSLIPTLVIGILLTVVSSITTRTNMKSQVEDEALSLAYSYKVEIETKIKFLSEDFALVISNNDVVNEDLSVDERKAILNDLAEVSNFSDFSISYADGTTYNNTDISGRDYFKYSMENKSYYVSSPVVRMTDNSLTIMMGRYFTSNGNDYLAYGGLDVDLFNKLISDVRFGEKCVCYILDRDGVIIASSDTSSIPILTDLTDGSADTGFDGLTRLSDNMLAREEGTDIVKFDGEDYLFGYMPVNTSEDWSIAIGTTYTPIEKDMLSNIIMFVAILIACSACIVFVVTIRARKVCKPIVECADRLMKFAAGDISSPPPECHEDNETKIMADSLAEMISTMNEYIGDIRNVLSSVSDGDLTVSPSAAYNGDFMEIKDALDHILDSLNSTMKEVEHSAVEVREGAAQLADSAQSLSQNAVTQASSVDEISNTVTTIAEKTEANNANVTKALENAHSTNEQAQNGSRCMNDLLDAISDIEQSAREIENIIKVIDDIAFQTNILALNAAIEAARAGEAGKGFAVVADEVRNLASKSSEAAKQTGKLIMKSIESVSKGAELARTASGELDEIVVGVEEVADVMNAISAASSEQSEGIDKICSGMEMVNAAIHNTSATSEESAAASEKLSALAVSLSDTVCKFTCKQ